MQTSTVRGLLYLKVQIKFSFYFVHSHPFSINIITGDIQKNLLSDSRFCVNWNKKMLHFVYRGKLISTCTFPRLLYNFSKISGANIIPPSIPEFRDNQQVRPYVSYGCTWNYTYTFRHAVSASHSHLPLQHYSVKYCYGCMSDNRLPLLHIEKTWYFLLCSFLRNKHSVNTVGNDRQGNAKFQGTMHLV